MNSPSLFWHEWRAVWRENRWIAIIPSLVVLSGLGIWHLLWRMAAGEAALDAGAMGALDKLYDEIWLMSGWLLGFWILKRPDVRDVQSHWLTLPVPPRLLMAARLLMLAMAQVVMPTATAWVFMRCVFPELAYSQTMAVAGLGLFHWVLASFSALSAPGWRGLVLMVLSWPMMIWLGVFFRLIPESIGDWRSTRFGLHYVQGELVDLTMLQFGACMMGVWVVVFCWNPLVNLRPFKWISALAVAIFCMAISLVFRHPKWSHPALSVEPLKHMIVSPLDAEGVRELTAADKKTRVLRRMHRYYAVASIDTGNLFAGAGCGSPVFTDAPRPGVWDTKEDAGRLSLNPSFTPSHPVVRSHWEYARSREEGLFVGIASARSLLMENLAVAALAKALPEADWQLRVRSRDGKSARWESLHAQNIRPKLHLRVEVPNLTEWSARVCGGMNFRTEVYALRSESVKVLFHGPVAHKVEVDAELGRYVFKSNAPNLMQLSYFGRSVALRGVPLDDRHGLSDVSFVVALVHPKLRQVEVIEVDEPKHTEVMGVIQYMKTISSCMDKQWLAGAEWLVLRPEPPAPVLIPVEMTVSPTPTL